MRLITAAFLLLLTTSAFADPATTTGQGNIQTLLEEQNVLLQQLIDKPSAGGGGSSDRLWLFRPTFTNGFCRMELQNMGSDRIQQHRANGGPGTGLANTVQGALQVGPTISGGLEHVIAIGATPGSSTVAVVFERLIPFNWALFLKLNGLDLSTPMTTEPDGIHIDCVAANELVMGDLWPLP